jgi:hypothetical protein
MPAKKYSKKKGILPYGVIQEQFTTLLTFTVNMLEREWSPRYRNVDSARVLFFQEFRNAINTFHTILYICADTPKDPHRLPIFALSLPPLTRTLFEQLIMFVFLLEDVPAFVPWLFKTGYTEVRIELEHCQKYHGQKANWKKYIAGLKKKVAEMERSYKLTQREISKPKDNIGRGPTPGNLLYVLRNNRQKSKAIPFIEYIQSWLYRELSGQSHLNVLELVNRGVLFSIDDAKVIFGAKWEEKRDAHLQDYRQNQVFIAITMMLAISTEIEAHFHYGKKEDIKFLWTVLNDYSDMTKDLWETRYRDLLPD